MNKVKNINFNITKDLFDIVQIMANNAERSLSAQIRYMLAQYIKEHEND